MLRRQKGEDGRGLLILWVGAGGVVGRRLRFLAGPRNDSEKGLGMGGEGGLGMMGKGGLRMTGVGEGAVKPGRTLQ